MSTMPLKSWDALGLCLGVTASAPGGAKSWSRKVPISTVVVSLPLEMGIARN